MTSLNWLPVKNLGDFETDLDFQFFENLFNEDCKCESAHEKVTIEYCSVVATHRASQTCKKMSSKNICEVLAKANLQYMKSGRHCRTCRLPASDCWIITPI